MTSCSHCPQSQTGSCLPCTVANLTAEVARLRAVLETLDEYITTGASHEALRVVVFDALKNSAP